MEKPVGYIIREQSLLTCPVFTRCATYSTSSVRLPENIQPPLQAYAASCQPSCMDQKSRRAWVMEASVSVRPGVCCSRSFGNGKPSWRLQQSAHGASHHHQSPHKKIFIFPEFLAIHARHHVSGSYRTCS